MKRQLTDAQAAFAADNHQLIFDFLNQNKLSGDEYYDTVVFAFLECVTDFGGQPDFRQKCFEAMQSAADKLAKEKEPKIISIYESEGFIRTIEEMLSDNRDDISELIERIDAEKLLSCYDRNEQEIIRLLYNGFSFCEIQTMLSQTAEGFSEIIGRINNKAACTMRAA